MYQFSTGHCKETISIDNLVIGCHFERCGLGEKRRCRSAPRRLSETDTKRALVFTGNTHPPHKLGGMGTYPSSPMSLGQALRMTGGGE